MKNIRRKNREKAQTFMEYTIILGVIVVILFAMTPLIKRGTQGMIKVVADQVGVQQNAEQDFDSGSYLESSYSTTRTALDKTTTDLLGTTGYIFADDVDLETGTIINLGFTKDSAP